MTDGGTNEHQGPPPTWGEIEAAKAYTDEVARFAIDHLADLPLDLKSKLRAFNRNPTVELQMELVVRMASEAIDMTWNSYQDASPDPDDLHQRAAFFTLVCTNICSEVKKQTVGNSGPQTSLTSMILERVAFALPAAQPEQIEPIRKTAEALLFTQDKHYIWYEAKLAHMYTSMLEKRDMMSYIEKIEPLLDYSELKEANDQLAISTRYLQKYLPKQCIAPALPDSQTHEWLVAPPFEAWRSSRFHPAHNHKVVMFGSKDTIQSTTTNVHDIRDEAYIQMATIDGINGRNKTLGTAIGSDGELYTIYGHRWLDYLPQDKRGAYEKLRSELLCIYHDSVVPVFITELVEQELQMSEAAAAKNPDGENPPFTGLRKLILARKLIDETLKQEIIDELENPDKDLVEHRELSKHEVIGHIRRLPKHYRASQAARDMCYRDMGVILAEYGETYVRTHERGSKENKGSGHKAVFTAGRMAAATANPSNPLPDN